MEGLEAGILGDLDRFFARGAHDEGRDEHDAPGRDDLEIVGLHLQGLVVEVGQAQAQATVEVAGGCPALDGGMISRVS